MRRSPAERGQAAPLALGLGVLLSLVVMVVGALGWVQVAAARAQTAADLASISGARALRADFGRLSMARGPDRRRLATAIEIEVAEVARRSGARLNGISFGQTGWPPVSLEVRVSLKGPMGLDVSAASRAGFALASALGDEGMSAASGGGYSGPLVHRDGKPTCPAVAAAFDQMDVEANRDGTDLVVTSGFRSDAEQAILFARHPDPRWVARPGESRHRDATELDISMGGGPAWRWLRANAERFGFRQRYSWEPWHFGYLPGCGGGMPHTGFASTETATVPKWVPSRYRALVVRAAAVGGVPAAVLAGLLQAESGFNPFAVSPAGAQGIAQFMPQTARAVGLADSFDAEQAIPAAGRHLGALLREFGRVDLALAAYNAGSGAVRRYGGVPPYVETRAYVARILALAGGAGLSPGPFEVTLLPTEVNV